MRAARRKESILPCKTCPWRVNRDATTIPRYNQKLAEGLMKTVGKGDAFRTIMACHGSTEEETVACKGYLAQEGWSNLNVRLLVSQKKIPNPDDVMHKCITYGVELETDYKTVLKKLTASYRRRHDVHNPAAS